MGKVEAAWLKAPEILGMQCALLQKALAEWPRRTAPLLAVNCGAGEFLPFLWQSGFDLIATEADRGLLQRARLAHVPDMSVYASDDTDLPFENESFDWAIAHLKSGEKDYLEAVSREAFRVAKRGLMFTFWNENSVPLLLWRVLERNKWPAPTVNWRKVCLAAKENGDCKITGLAILCGPVKSWTSEKLFGWLNRKISFLPFGAWAIVRVDFQNAKPVTPMPLLADSGMAETDRQMEWAHKRDVAPHKDYAESESESG